MDAPPGVVEVTDEVEALKQQLNEIFADQNMSVVSIAIGAALADACEDEATIKGMIHNIATTAATIWSAAHTSPIPEGVTVQ